MPDLIELWSPTKLGRTAGTIYHLLGDLPASVGQLERRTGKAWGTVKAALTRLEALDLATKLDTGWILGKGNLMDVSTQFEIRNAAMRRRSCHKRQREAFSEFLAKHQKVNKPR